MISGIVIMWFNIFVLFWSQEPITCTAFPTTSSRTTTNRKHSYPPIPPPPPPWACQHRHLPLGFREDPRWSTRKQFATSDMTTKTTSEIIWKKISANLQPTRTTKRMMMNPVTTGTAAAAAGASLVGSSLFGILLERFVIPNSGILGTLIMAATLSHSFPWVPSHHALYDVCWDFVLPASLALLLFSNSSNSRRRENNDEATPLPSDNSSSSSVINAILRVGGPFILASLGSLLGCWFSGTCATTYGWLPVEQARAAMACLAASFVGGSVNFFAAARILQAPSDLLSSMATADLIVMAAYFAILSATLEWKWLKSKFRFHEKDTADHELEDTGNTATTDGLETIPEASISTKFVASIPLLLMTGLVVTIANWVERLLKPWIPGTACAVIAMVVPFLNRYLSRIKAWEPMSEVAAVLADVFFLTFFASIGVGANLSEAVQLGPRCLVFSLVALMVHLLVTTIGSKILFGKLVALEDVWIASNAAIGGPATAAAFCNRMKSNSRNNRKLQGRVLAATFWGVVGYAIGTPLGVGLYHLVGGNKL